MSEVPSSSASRKLFPAVRAALSSAPKPCHLGRVIPFVSFSLFLSSDKTEIRMTLSEQRSHDCFPKSQDISPCILAIFQLGKLPSASLNPPLRFQLDTGFFALLLKLLRRVAVRG